MKSGNNVGYEQLKRILDIEVSLLALIILSPLFVVIAIILKIENPGEKVIFLQKRIGRGGKVFKILKFRSMKKTAPNNIPAKKLKMDDNYYTVFGKFLRKSCIDELPQLFNVLFGDMSIVGPRPLIKEEGAIHRKRMESGIYKMRPGITGLAQIHGGNSISDTEKLAWDIKYLKRKSIILDLKICFKTCDSVFANFRKI